MLAVLFGLFCINLTVYYLTFVSENSNHQYCHYINPTVEDTIVVNETSHLQSEVKCKRHRYIYIMVLKKVKHVN